MNSADVIAYQWDGARYCHYCAEEIHGAANLDNSAYCDDNEIGVVFCGQEVDGYRPECCDACGEEIDGLVYLDAIRRGSLYVHNGASAFYLRGKTAGGKDVELACLGDGVDIVPRRYMNSRRLSISHFGDEDELAAAYNFILD